MSDPIKDDVERAARAMWDALNPDAEAAKAWPAWRETNLKRARGALLAYHRSRIPSPDEVEAVARAMFELLRSQDGPWSYAQGPSPNDITLDGQFDLQDVARAALQASDAFRVKELERMK